jgi:uncharacterized membrane protein
MRNWKFSTFFIGFLVLINVLPVLAPIFMNWGWIVPAKVIYFIYSFFCHQIHWRSVHLYDHQCAWCARDMAIWGSLLIVALLIKFFKLKGIKWYQVIPFVIPIALDGGLQTIATAIDPGGGTFYVSTNLMRTITGSIFGVGLGLMLTPMLIELEVAKLKDRAEILIGKIKLTINALNVGIIAFLGYFLYYLILVFAWQTSSALYKPANFVDFEVKAPLSKDVIIERRLHAVCPVEITREKADIIEMLALNCFSNK